MKNIDPVQVFSVLANETRLRCLALVNTNRDVCVCEVVAALSISQPAASKALGALKAVGLLDSRRDANWTYYRMQADAPVWLREIVEATLREQRNRQPFRADQRRFEALNLREAAEA